MLLWSELVNLLNSLDKNFNFLDAGCGTGEWSYKILKNYNASTGDIIDFSKEMIQKCKNKLSLFEDRVQISLMNLEKINYIDNKFDIAFNIYVLPFLQNQDKVMSELARVTKKGGYVVSVAENYYNALSLNILTGEEERINNVYINKYEKIGNKIPKLKYHTVDDLKIMYQKNNLEIIDIKGFPLFSITGIREKLTKNKYNINEVLSNPRVFNTILEIEKRYINRSDLVSRGKYILIIGRKI